jgi:hypothetical protein
MNRYKYLILLLIYCSLCMPAISIAKEVTKDAVAEKYADPATAPDSLITLEEINENVADFNRATKSKPASLLSGKLRAYRDEKEGVIFRDNNNQIIDYNEREQRKKFIVGDAYLIKMVFAIDNDYPTKTIIHDHFPSNPSPEFFANTCSQIFKDIFELDYTRFDPELRYTSKDFVSIEAKFSDGEQLRELLSLPSLQSAEYYGHNQKIETVLPLSKSRK